MCACLKLRVPHQKGAFGRQNAPFWKGSLIWEQAQNSWEVAHLLLDHIARAGEVLLRTLFTQRDNGTTLARRLWESAHLRKSAEFMLIVFVRKSARFEAHYSFKKRPPWGAVESANGKRKRKAHSGKRIYVRFAQTESAFILDLRKREAHLFEIAQTESAFILDLQRAHLFCRKRKWKAHYLRSIILILINIVWISCSILVLESYLIMLSFTGFKQHLCFDENLHEINRRYSMKPELFSLLYTSNHGVGAQRL